MWAHLSQRLLSLLQLTRMALVFTAVADGLCTILLAAQRRAELEGTSLSPQLDGRRVLAAAAVSVGLYGFGMSLNDIIDRRRDSQISPHRPIPSGRLGVAAAHLVCAALVVMAVWAGALYSVLARDPSSQHVTHASPWIAGAAANWMSLVLVVWTGMLIAFYDLAGKYLVALGLLTLGLIRFFHALVPAPHVPVLWHPLWLLNHVVILSTFAYGWEEKRPPLTRRHWWAVLGGLGAIDAMLIALVANRRSPAGEGILKALSIEPGLALPAVASLAFVLLAWRVRRKSASSREAGQALMLYGLLWLIVYDAAFVAGYTANPLATLAVLALLPLAYGSVQLMRWWSKLVALSQRPDFKRART
jgi:4-hydroxybenzoate polyprenyltransferase